MSAIDELRQTVARLRGPGGCPWDQEQDHQSLARCLMEECCELLDAIDRKDIEHMREELGDVLIQVVFHAQIAEEKGQFSLEDVAREINEKLIRRHPHVFGEVKLETSDEVVAQWEQIKAGEKKRPASEAVFKKLPAKLPALLYAQEVYKQIDKKDLDSEGLIDAVKVKSLGSGLQEGDAGRMLFEIAAACRHAGIDPESAVRRHTQGIVDRIEKQRKA